MPDDTQKTPDDVMTEALAAAAAEDALPEAVETPPVESETPPAEPVEASPAEEQPPAEEPAPPEEPPAEEQPPETPPAELTPEQQAEKALVDEAKELGLRSQKATERFRELSAKANQVEPLTARIAEMERPAAMWQETERFLGQHGLDLNVMGEALTMVAAIRSDDPRVLEPAAKALEQELQQVYRKLGREGGGYDPLAEQANRDLADAVASGEIDRARALEFAQHRHRVAHYEQRETRTREQAEQERQMSEARAGAVEALNKLGDEYTAIDPRFQEKAAILEPVMKTLFAKSHPSTWADLYRQAYANVKLPEAPAAAAAPPPLRNQPLRTATTTPAVGAAELKTPDDVMTAALRQAAAMDGVVFRG